MSWISKVKQFLFGETEEIVEVVEYVRVDDNEQVQEIRRESKPAEKSHPPENVRASASQFETKISYQYPEGNFRFPAIPDDRRRPARPKKNRPASAENANKKMMDHNKAEKGRRTVPKPPQAEPTYKRKVEPLSGGPKKPFQPTLIPSPIYGFQNRSDMESLPYKMREKSLAESRMQEEETLRKLSMHSSSFYKKRAAETVQKQTKSEKGSFLSDSSDINSGLPPSFLEKEEEIYETEAAPRGAENMQGEHFLNPDAEAANIPDIEEERPLALSEKEEEEGPKMVLEEVEENDDFTWEEETSAEPESFLIFEENTAEKLDLQPLPAEETENSDDRETQDFLNEDPAEETLSSEAHYSDPAAEEIPQRSPESRSAEKDRAGRETAAEKPKSSVPFNVLMLNRDKSKMKERVQEGSYYFPPLNLLTIPPREESADDDWLYKQKELLDSTLKNFNVRAKVVHVTQGPSVTRFEVQPEPGVKVNKITNLSDDIKLSLSAKDIRIEAPIPGKNAIGIEVPNLKSKTVSLREIIRSQEFKKHPSPLTVALGLDISGQPIVTDLKKMPHGLIAGATGSGKSVCINSMLISLLYKAAPHEVKMLLIDPKMVELAPYNRIPHLVSPVITDAKAATGALKWAVEEMERRYELFAHSGVRDINRFNELVKTHQRGEHLPYLVIVIDELADLMMVAPGEVEEAICRIAQKARACGIHLIVATQRPSVDVITGLIKANIPTRIAFSVSSQVDSRTILDAGGAEKLLGRGDMLFLENGTSKHLRVQGNFVSDDEMEQVVTHVKKQMEPVYLFNQEEFLKKSSLQTEEDDLFLEACEFVVTQNGASASSLQRRFRIGYNRAARLIDLMEDQGIISEAKGSRPRDILISEDELLSIQESNLI
ncbi:DNA translocase FtsK [Metabacillus sp. 113a]|uniref:DNA translocase FtsK n=1 Tax=Metabacillus sp. 113a TaxID=3404706 RepID=UPI003CEB0464